jgi:signal transduction histidine kinase
LPLFPQYGTFALSLGIQTVMLLDVVIFLLVLFGILLFALSIPISITACVAASSTRHWKKEKARRAQIGTEEAEQLVNHEDSEDFDDDDFVDSEDEDYFRTKAEQQRKLREEQALDWQLSTSKKFLKEWKKCWTGSSGVLADQAREKELKEQDERRKIAREAVREYLRIQKKKARKSAGAVPLQDDGMELPSYGKVVSQKSKQ